MSGELIDGSGSLRQRITARSGIILRQTGYSDPIAMDNSKKLVTFRAWMGISP
jgi:hypothetical protein